MEKKFTGKALTALLSDCARLELEIGSQMSSIERSAFKRSGHPGMGAHPIYYPATDGSYVGRKSRGPPMGIKLRTEEDLNLTACRIIC